MLGNYGCKPFVFARLQHLEQRHSLMGSPRHMLNIRRSGKQLQILGYRTAYAIGYLVSGFGITICKLHYHIVQGIGFGSCVFFVRFGWHIIGTYKNTSCLTNRGSKCLQ